jgi:hypothetical protein
MKSTFKSVGIVLLSAIMVVSGFIYAVPAQLNDSAVTVTYIEGYVDVRYSGSDRFVPLEKGKTLNAGDLIQTDTEGAVEIKLVDKSVLKIGPSSSVLIKELGTLEVTKVSVTTFELIKGKLRAVVSPLINKESRFEIETTNATVGVRGTDFVEGFDPDTESTYVIGLDDCVSLSLTRFPGSIPISICGTEELRVTGAKAPGSPTRASRKAIDRVLQDMKLKGETGGVSKERKPPYITGIFINRTIDLERVEGTLTLTKDDLSVDGRIIISGQSKDDDGRVTAVEVSFDGGITFEKANGTETWTYEFAPRENTEYEIAVRAVNDAGLSSDPHEIGPVTVAYKNERYEDVARWFVENFVNGVKTGDSRAIEDIVTDGYDGAVGEYYSKDELIQTGIEDLAGRVSGTTISYTIDQVSSLADKVVVVTGWSMTSGTTKDNGKTTWWLSKFEDFRLTHAEGDWLLRAIETVEPALWVEFYDNGTGPPCNKVAKVFLRAPAIPDSVSYVQVQVQTSCGNWSVFVDRWYYETYVGDKNGFGSDVPLETMISACVAPSCATYIYQPFDAYFECSFTDYGYDLTNNVTIP